MFHSITAYIFIVCIFNRNNQIHHCFGPNWGQFPTGWNSYQLKKLCFIFFFFHRIKYIVEQLKINIFLNATFAAKLKPTKNITKFILAGNQATWKEISDICSIKCSAAHFSFLMSQKSSCFAAAWDFAGHPHSHSLFSYVLLMPTKFPCLAAAIIKALNFRI